MEWNGCGMTMRDVRGKGEGGEGEMEWDEME